MDKNKIEEVLNDYREGKIEIGDALDILKKMPYDDLGFAKIDNHRSLRLDYPESIFCKGKSLEQIISIIKRQSKANKVFLATKASKEIYDAVKDQCENIEYNETARMIIVGRKNVTKAEGKIIIVTAGTSDIPIAEEAAITAEVMGNNVEKIFDVGVAGIHRFFDHLDIIREASVIIVIAGMDGALPSILGGLVSVPVIAVPTSVGYGASFDGLAALLTMLNSCAPGISVVNIDNGFGAGYSAGIINRRRLK